MVIESFCKTRHGPDDACVMQLDASSIALQQVARSRKGQTPATNGRSTSAWKSLANYDLSSPAERIISQDIFLDAVKDDSTCSYF